MNGSLPAGMGLNVLEIVLYRALKQQIGSNHVRLLNLLLRPLSRPLYSFMGRQVGEAFRQEARKRFVKEEE
jgi:hypothetical protein